MFIELSGDNMEKRPEIDTSMFAGVNYFSGSEKRKREKEELESSRLADERFNEIIDSFYKNSVQDEKKSKRQRVRGETYKGKKDLVNNVKIALKMSAIIISFGVAMKGINIYTTVDNYNDVLKEKMENELTEDNINAYNTYHDNPIIDGIEDYKMIRDTMKELKETGNYDFFGKNIGDPDKEYSDFDVDGYNLTNLESDAIDIVSDKVIDEYKNISVRGGK